MAIKLKPVRGEISATNPIPDQGASILNAVIQSDPNIQSTVNTLGALTEREKTHRQNLEKVRIANKVKLNEQLLRKDLLATEEAVTKGDIQGNLLSPEQIDANKAALHKDYEKQYGYSDTNKNAAFYKDKAAYDAFASSLYHQLNNSTDRIKKERDRSILVNSDIIYNGQVDLRFEEINALPPNKNYWQHFDIIKEKFVNDVLDKKGIDDKLNFDDEIERLDLYSWRNLYEKTYTMVDANGRTVPDYAQIYVALTSPEQIQKLDLDIPLGKMEMLITSKLKKNLGKNIPENLRKTFLAEIEDSLRDQVYVEKYIVNKDNKKVLDQFETDLIDPEKNISYADIDTYAQKLKGEDRSTFIASMRQSLNDKQTGKIYEVGEKALGDVILAKAHKGEITNIQQKFTLPGETEGKSIIERIRDDEISYLGTSTFVKDFTDATKFYSDEKGDLYKLIEESPLTKNLNKSLIGNQSLFKPIANELYSGVVNAAFNKAQKMKAKAARAGVPFENKDLFDPKSPYFIFTEDFVNAYKFDDKEITDRFSSSRTDKNTVSYAETRIILNTKSNAFKNLQKNGITTYNTLVTEFLASKNIEGDAVKLKQMIIDGTIDEFEFAESDIYLKWAFDDPVKRIPSINKLYHDFNQSKKINEFIEENNIPLK